MKQRGSRMVQIVMEFADGGDMYDMIQRHKASRRPFSEAQIRTWFVQMCLALGYVHEQGMVHRDVKTANLFLNKDGTLKIGDFGIAKELEHNSPRLSGRTCATPIGTPMYMAPEICHNRRYGQKADIWAAGCVLYEMMTFQGAFTASSMSSLMHRIKKGLYNHSMPSSYSPALRQLVHDMLHLDPQRRPAFRDILAMDLFAAERAEAAKHAAAFLAEQGAPELALDSDSDTGSSGLPTPIGLLGRPRADSTTPTGPTPVARLVGVRRVLADVIAEEVDGAASEAGSRAGSACRGRRSRSSSPAPGLAPLPPVKLRGRPPLQELEPTSVMGKKRPGIGARPRRGSLGEKENQPPPPQPPRDLMQLANYYKERRNSPVMSRKGPSPLGHHVAAAAAAKQKLGKGPAGGRPQVKHAWEREHPWAFNKPGAGAGAGAGSKVRGRARPPAHGPAAGSRAPRQLRA